MHFFVMRVKLFLPFFLFIASAAYADARLNDLVGRLQQRYQNLQTLKASFVQTYASKRFSDALTEKGVVYFRKGGLMKWEYQHPEPKIFASDGRYYFYYVVADKQVIKAEPEPTDQHSPALFLAGRGNFQKDFRAEWADSRSGSHLIKLTPIKVQPDFSYMIIDVDPSRALITRLLVVDAYDNRTEYKFTQIHENPELPPNFFMFKPPPGTDVIFQRAESNQVE